ncbi:MAG TPA: DMT family transporter [Nevskiaceae bacterium]
MKGYAQVHLCVVLWGFSAILGRVISLDAFSLVWWRTVLAVALLLAVPRVWRELRAIPRRHLGAYAGIGALLSGSWILFYLSVKLANASVAAICMGAAPLVLALIEPMVGGERFSLRQLLLGIGVIPGVVLVAGGAPAAMRLGLLVGIAAAATAAGFTVLNKRMVHAASPLCATSLELGAGAVVLSLAALAIPGGATAIQVPHGQDVWLVLVLAFGVTLAPILLMLMALRHVSAFAQQAATNLEPVYAVIFAIPILGEQHQLGPLFYLGVVVVVGTVVLEPSIRLMQLRRLAQGWRQ